MTLKSNFLFSQNNLQDYVDCQRRFELKYILKQQWPAPQTEPVLEQERQMDLGTQFHLLVQQDILGIDRAILTEQAARLELDSQWNAYLDQDPLSSLPGKKWSEIQLSTPLAGYRLLAQYDVLVYEEVQQAFIVDWKTATNKPSRNTMKNRLQTRVYLFVLVQAGSSLFNSAPLRPEQVSLMYWFSEHPKDPEVFQYGQELFLDDQAYLNALVEEIANRPAGEFALTTDNRKCQFCSYRSLCDRGIEAGSLANAGLVESDPQDGLDLNFEQIGEVDF